MPQGGSCSDSMNPSWPLAKRISFSSQLFLCGWQAEPSQQVSSLWLSFRARASTISLVLMVPIFYKSGTIRGIRPPDLELHWATADRKRTHNKAPFRKRFHSTSVQIMLFSVIFSVPFLPPLGFNEAGSNLWLPESSKNILGTVIIILPSFALEMYKEIFVETII